ncbi:MAG: DUF4288 domain-containing protein, partial [Thermodesulfobacteriota bacterium]
MERKDKFVLPDSELLAIKDECKSSRRQKKYAVKLLFQYKSLNDKGPSKRRMCEKRIKIIYASSARVALNKAKRYAKRSEFNCLNEDDSVSDVFFYSTGSKVSFQFVGIVDLIRLDQKFTDDVLWSETKRYLTPMERKDKLIPDENMLSAIKWKD